MREAHTDELFELDLGMLVCDIFNRSIITRMEQQLGRKILVDDEINIDFQVQFNLFVIGKEIKFSFNLY